MSRQGRPFSVEEKEIVVRIKHFFDKEKKVEKNKGRFAQSAVALTAEATEFSEISIARIMAEYNKGNSVAPPAPKGSTPHAVDERAKTICREEIRAHNIRRDHLSLRKLGGVLHDKYDISVARETLRLNLARWGIVYGPVLRHTALREKDHVVAARRDYLSRKIDLNHSSRNIVYLDETFINKNYSGTDLSWYCNDWEEDPLLDKTYGPYINKPSGKGDRLIILNAVTSTGWVKNAKLVFQAKTCSGDYHGSMDEHNFTKWFTKQLLPNIPDGSVIIMDNAPYHNMCADDGVPALNSKKSDMQQWLFENNINFEKDYLRAQLIELINACRPVRQFKIDYMLKNDTCYRNRDIEIMRTPQYHPELQPIEKCWAVLKQYMAQHCDFTTNGLRKNLDNAWRKVTKKTMRGIMEKVYYWENHHFDQDRVLDGIDESEAV